MMKNTSTYKGTLSPCLIARSYENYHSAILSYIQYRINHKYDAEDLAQDVFVRLLDYKPMIQETTVKYFLFTISRNIVTDYLRRYYKKQEVSSYIYDTSVRYCNEVEENCIARDLLLLECYKLNTFAPQRKKVYLLSRFEGDSVHDISEKMQLSRRTVENHLLLGRKIMRAYMQQCI